MIAITKKYLIPVFATSLLLAGASQVVHAQADTSGIPLNNVVVSTADTTTLIVTGTVKSAYDKKGILGIEIGVDNFSAAITDSNGNFTIKVPSYSASLQVSSEGFQSREIPLLGRRSVTIILNDESLKALSDPIVLPTGDFPKKAVVASVQEYEPNGSLHQPFDITDAALQGRLAGLNAVRRSGTPGVGANLFLRGFTSLYGTNKPLIVVDGMLYDAEDYGPSIIANNYTNPLSMIDVKDIENVTVLRDASSLYGTKGANGAILITTARAKGQATKIDFGLFTQSNFAPEGLPVMKAADYRTYLSEILQSKGLSAQQVAAMPYMNDDPNSPGYAANHYETDWQKKVMSNSNSQNLFLKITGGDNIATYGLTVAADRDHGIMTNTSMLRYNTRFNAEFNFTRRLTGTANLSFAYAEQNLKDQGLSPKTAPLYVALTKSPFLPDRELNAAGIESPNYADRDTFGVSNPSVLTNTALFYNKYYRFFGSFRLDYKLANNIKVSSLIGLTFDKNRENIFLPRKGVADDTLLNAVADSRLGSQVKRLFSLYNDTRISYNNTFGGVHAVAANVGFRFQNNHAEQDYALGYNSATDELISIQNGVAALRQVGGNTGEWGWVNTYLNLDYGFRKKYFISYNMAVDGSSRFGVDGTDGINIGGHRFAVMPSIGGAWLVSSENFMRGTGINMLKLRATYSMTGNDDIGNYSAQQTYVSQNLLGMQGLVRNGIPNTKLQWEVVKKLNAGIDISTLNERITLTADVFQNSTSNMLVYETISSVTGFNTVLTNGGSMKTTGADVSLSARVINHRKLKWDVSINLSKYKNQVLQVPGSQFTTDYAGGTFITANGGVANLFYGYKTLGVFATDAAAAEAGLSKKNADGSYTSFKAGDVHFADANGDKVIDGLDRQVIGNPNPDYTGGIATQVSWKGITLSALFTFSKGNQVYNYVRSQLEAADGTDNQLLSVNNRWHAQGQVTDMPKATYGDPMGNNRFSDRWIEDGSYFRLRNISLSYSLPLKSGSVVKSASVYANATNLFTWSKYLGYDPEFSARSSVFAQGVDTGLDPIYRSIMFGVRVGL